MGTYIDDERQGPRPLGPRPSRLAANAPSAASHQLILRAPPNGTNRRRCSLDRRHLAGMGNTTRAGGTPALRAPPAWPPGIINGGAEYNGSHGPGFRRWLLADGAFAANQSSFVGVTEHQHLAVPIGAGMIRA